MLTFILIMALMGLPLAGARKYPEPSAAFKRKVATEHEALVNKVNGLPGGTWRAKHNLNSHRQLCNLTYNISATSDWTEAPEWTSLWDSYFTKSTVEPLGVGEKLPETFDARTKWKADCVHLDRPALNQGACGSCWATAPVSAWEDRICIQSGGAQRVNLSVFDVLSCTSVKVPPGLLSNAPDHIVAFVKAEQKCYNYSMTDPRVADCYGGTPDLAEMYFKKFGVVTGGPYDAKGGAGCRPYPFDALCGGPCAKVDWHHEDLTCDEHCQPRYQKKYKNDKYKGFAEVGVVRVSKCHGDPKIAVHAYDHVLAHVQFQMLAHSYCTTLVNFHNCVRLWAVYLQKGEICLAEEISKYANKNNEDEDKIKLEIYRRGSVVAWLPVFADMIHYASVYQKVADDNTFCYWHIIKIIGWGTDPIPYFLVSNSWGLKWGENGFGKIDAKLFGSVTAAKPKL